ncbi:MAG: hypothetical protein KAH01_02600, partial [Caldisericia bacterium]|nr:hypothetical protein [Caldisericia bacterium]
MENELESKHNDHIIKNTFGCFIENKGQWNSEILFMGGTSFGKVAFTKNNVWYGFGNTSSKLSFLNSSSHYLAASEVQKQVTNYIQGPRDEWCINCKNYSQITYKNLWGNNDCTYYFSESGLHYEFSDKSNIEVKISGKSLAEIKEQFIANKNKSNISQTKTKEKPKNPEIEPRINPNDLTEDAVVYCTFLGGYRLDDCSGIVVDKEECIYVAGSTKSKFGDDHFPIKEPCFSNENNGDYDMFVTKLNPSGDEIIYSTFIGGTDYDFCNDVCIDASNNIYLVGNTFSNNSEKFPVGNNIPGFDKTYGRNNDAVTGYILKLNSTGTDLIYSSYIGGDSNDYCNSIILDDSNHA